MNLRMGPRHLLMALVVVVLAGLAAAGCVGPAVGTERIHSFQVDALVREDRSVAVREVIDWDFGSSSKRGIFRLIPSDGGVPVDITVSSPDAPEQFSVGAQGTDTEIRIGDPDVTITGRHRYVIGYTLRNTIVGRRFALDAVGTTWPVAVESADVTIRGATLEDPRCFTGNAGSTDRCDLTVLGDGYRSQVDHLARGEGITIDGDLVSTKAATVAEPAPFEERDPSAPVRWAAIVGLLAALVAVAGFIWARRVGRNEVASGGATEAAFVPYGSETFGPQHPMPSAAPPPLPGAQMVADTKMGELAGLEFVPPGGVEPWQASVVLREVIDDRTVGAWFSSLAAHDIITLEGSGDDVVLGVGPAFASADRVTQGVLAQALDGQRAVALGSYDPGFAAAWQHAGALVSQWVASSQVFRRRPPRFGGGSSSRTRTLGGSTLVVSGGGGLGFLPCLILPVLLVVGGGAASLGGLRSAFAAVAAALVIPAVGTWFAYGHLTRSLSARGSAIALRSESFRRFLHDSEAQHVEWAWENGLLREYSAWAVALGEADAWNQAMSASSVPPPELTSSYGVMLPVFYASSFTSAMTAPAPAGGGGFGSSGGGFSGGGFSGGGGGGGGGGSW